MVFPDLLQQHGAGDHLAFVAHEEFEQAEFGGGEGDFLAAQMHLATGAVELEVTVDGERVELGPGDAVKRVGEAIGPCLTIRAAVADEDSCHDYILDAVPS